MRGRRTRRLRNQPVGRSEKPARAATVKGDDAGVA